ncbi:hypothetical protein ACTG9Q_13310 [Actinokineospora sp. 24-640]
MTTQQLPYRWRERLRDRHRGRRDGRGRVPMLEHLQEMAEQDGSVTAPYAEQLFQGALLRMESERHAFEQRVHGDRTDLIRMREQLASAVVGLDRDSKAVVEAQAELTQAELRPRNPIELAMENQAVVHSRRDVVRNRRITRARAVEADSYAEVDALNHRIAVTKERITKEFVVAQTRALCVAEHCALRVAAYWENVVISHPEGAHLAPLLRFASQVVPDWVVAPPAADPADLGRGPVGYRQIVRRVNAAPRGRAASLPPEGRSPDVEDGE